MDINWKLLHKNITPWRIFDNENETIPVKQVVECVEEGMDSVFECWIDDLVGESYETAKYMIRELYDAEVLEEILENQKDEFDDFRFAIEAAAVYNIERILPGNVFVHDQREFDIPDYTYDMKQGELDAKDEESDTNLFEAKAIKHGFTDKDVEDVILNASYGGRGGVGVIADSNEIAKVINGSEDGKVTLSGTPILYIRDSWNGSGHYMLGKGNIQIVYTDREEVAKKIDCGRYCLGEVFGTSDWAYR